MPTTAFLEIGSASMGQQPVATWKAFSQSWVVELPNSFGAQVMVPQLCTGGVQCSRESSTQRLACVELLELLRAPGWHHAHIPVPADGCPALLGDWSTPQAVSAAQNALADPCVDPCMQVLPPHELEIFLGATELMPYAEQRADSEVVDGYVLLVRIVYVTEAAGQFAVHVASMDLSLHVPRELAGGVVELMHECVRRGLRAPPLSSLELTLTAQGFHACTWVCRPDHVRTPWNTPPPLRTQNRSEHICRPLPQSLSAIEFEMSIYTSLSGVVSELVPSEFFEELNAIALSLEDEIQLPDALVLMKVPGTVFDDTPFGTVVDTRVFFHSNDNQHSGYSILRNDAFKPSTARHLLQVQARSFLISDGIVFTSDTRISPARIDSELQRAVATPEIATPKKKLIQATNNYQVVRLYHNEWTPPVASESRLRDYALIAGGGVLVAVSFVLIFVATKCMQNRGRV